MSLDDQIRWDRQYGQSDRSEKPSTFLKQILDEGHWDIAPGRALDIASGAGRNALFLAAKGFAVTAVDISQVGLDQGARRAAEACALDLLAAGRPRALPAAAGTV